MVTLLDCIYRVPSVIDDIVDHRKEYTKPLLDYLHDRVHTLNEIMLIGSGTSNTCAVTSHAVVEEFSGLSTTAILPNEFLAKHAYNPNALYIFTSQSGTSTLTQEAQKKMKALGYATVAITEADTTPLAKESGCHVYMGCGKEEYGQRTIGYCSSILTQMMIGLEIGFARGYVSQEQYDNYIAEAKRVPASHKEITDASVAWFDANKDALMDVDSYVLYGPNTLWGVAMEGSLKILEIAKRFMAVGYEMDDGLHGPTMGFTNRHCIIILNDGGKDDHLAQGIAKYVKNEIGHAFMIGANTIDDTDLPFTYQGGHFKCLEYAPVVEVLAYRLAVDYGIEILPWDQQGPLPESKYFNTHDDE